MTEFVGVVHLQPLPGGPVATPGLSAVLARAEADAHALAAGGVDGLIVENFGDAPFAPGPVAPYTIAAMARAVARVRRAVGGLPVGVNVLRNDSLAAMSIAAATGASFVRINVHVGAMVTDQGIVEGQARKTLMLRRRLEVPVRIIADVMVKHAVPLGRTRIEDLARDTAYRGRADVLVVTGSGTGHATDPKMLERVVAAVPDMPVWVGSGITPEGVSAFDDLQGAIVGTWLHRDGRWDSPIDIERVQTMARALKGRDSSERGDRGRGS